MQFKMLASKLLPFYTRASYDVCHLSNTQQAITYNHALHLRHISDNSTRSLIQRDNILDSKVHGANMGPIWGRQDPGGPHVGPMNFAIWDMLGHLEFPLKFVVYTPYCSVFDHLYNGLHFFTYTFSIIGNTGHFSVHDYQLQKACIHWVIVILVDIFLLYINIARISS